MSLFTPEKYQAEGGFSAAGLLVFLGLQAAAAVCLGWLASFVSQWFYLIILFPIGMGFCLSKVGNYLIRQTKFRSPWMAMLIGLVSACVTIFSLHYFDYLRFLQDREEILKQLPFGNNLDALQALMQDPQMAQEIRILKQIQAVDSFTSYLNLEATQGVTISHRGQNEINLGYEGTWIYWSLELIVVAAMVTWGLSKEAAKPFCTACNQWTEERELGTLHGQVKEAAALLRAGDLEQLKTQHPTVEGGNLLLTVADCSDCAGQSAIAVKLMELTKNSRGEEVKTERLHLTYPAESLAQLEALFAPAPAEENPMGSAPEPQSRQSLNDGK